MVLDARYRVEARLGAGAFGIVYRGSQLTIDRNVAIKILNREASQSEGLVKRFQNEARIISKLRHPNTLKLIDFGRTPDGRLYIVTELLLGKPLDAVLADGPLSDRATLEIGAQICNSLIEAHEQGIIHRDLKPENVFIEQVGTQQLVKVLDFGIAKLGEHTKMTATGQIFGTPHYMSPEQGRGEQVDLRSDLYSLGILLYELITGDVPFAGTTPMSILLKHQQTTPKPLREILGEAPLHPPLESIVHRLLEKQADDRYESAVALKHALKQAAASLDSPSEGTIVLSEQRPDFRGPPVPVPAPPTERVDSSVVASAPASTAETETRSRPAVLKVLLIALTAMGVTLAGLMMFRDDTPQPDGEVATHDATIAPTLAPADAHILDANLPDVVMPDVVVPDMSPPDDGPVDADTPDVKPVKSRRRRAGAPPKDRPDAYIRPRIDIAPTTR